MNACTGIFDESNFLVGCDSCIHLFYERLDYLLDIFDSKYLKLLNQRNLYFDLCFTLLKSDGHSMSSLKSYVGIEIDHF